MTEKGLPADFPVCQQSLQTEPSQRNTTDLSNEICCIMNRYHQSGLSGQGGLSLSSATRAM